MIKRSDMHIFSQLYVLFVLSKNEFEMFLISFVINLQWKVAHRFHVIYYENQSFLSF